MSELDEKDVYRHTLAKEVQEKLIELGFVKNIDAQITYLRDEVLRLAPGDAIGLAMLQGRMYELNAMRQNLANFILKRKIPQADLAKLNE